MEKPIHKVSDFEPNSTQVPNVILDWIMGKLSGAEFKVLMFFVRQTYGFHRQGHGFSYSLTEIQNGITVTGGLQVSIGTGISRDSVLSALRNLESRGLIVVESRGNRKKVNRYKFGPLKSFGPNLVEKVDQPSRKIIPQPSRKSRPNLVEKVDPSETNENQSEIQTEKKTMEQDQEPKGNTMKHEPVNIDALLASLPSDPVPPPPMAPDPGQHFPEGMPEELKVPGAWFRHQPSIARDAHRERCKAWMAGKEWRHLPGPDAVKIALQGHF